MSENFEAIPEGEVESKPKPEQKTETKIKKRRQFFWSLEFKPKAVLIAVIILCLVAGYGMYKFSQWNSQWSLRFQLPVRNWIVIEPRTTKAKPVIKKAEAKEVEKIKAYTIPQIVDAVHILESSGGRKDGCVTRGEGVNGFGFAQHGSGEVWNCYKNYAEVRSLVEGWFTDKVPALGLSTALCYYNLGKVDGQYVSDCKYYQDFLKIVKS